MNTTNLTLAILLGAVAGSATALVTRADAAESNDAPRTAAAAVTPGARTTLEDLLATAEDLASRLELTERTVASLSGRVARSGGRVALGLSEEEIEAYLAQRFAGEDAAFGAAGEAKADPGSFGPDEIDAALARLDEIGNNEEAQLVWRELYVKGQARTVLDALAARTPDDDANAQTELGLANLWCLFQAQGAGDAMYFADGADTAFQRALAIDGTNWGARFARAVMLTNLPAVQGRASEAIAEFRTLIAQQEESEPRAQHAESYLYLGNMYQQIGEPEKAAAAWREGSRRFPDNEALARQLQRTGR